MFAAPSPEAVPLDSQQIAAVLAQNGIRVAEGQVELLTEIRATRADPAMEVMAVEPWQQASAKIRLRCRQREECLPFYVLVRWTSRRESETALGQWAVSEPHSTLPRGSQHGPWLVRNGERATLILEGEHSRVQLPVVCLANASAGTRIRVSSTDRKRIYVAEVVGNQLLKGGL